jgi:DNA-binding NarL/FixJ family response regulator
MYTNGKPLSVLVYAQPDRMSDALLSLLSGMQMIKEIDRIQDPKEAINTIRRKQTDLVLLDIASCEDGLQSLIPAIKRANPNIYCLSVVDTVRLGRASQQSGADHVLLRGFSGNELLEVIFNAQAYQMQHNASVMQKEPSYVLE